MSFQLGFDFVGDGEKGSPKDDDESVLFPLLFRLRFFFHVGVALVVAVAAGDERPWDAPGETNGGGARFEFWPLLLLLLVVDLFEIVLCGDKNDDVAPAELGGLGTDDGPALFLSLARNKAAAPANCESFRGVDGAMFNLVDWFDRLNY